MIALVLVLSAYTSRTPKARNHDTRAGGYRGNFNHRKLIGRSGQSATQLIRLQRLLQHVSWSGAQCSTRLDERQRLLGCSEPSHRELELPRHPEDQPPNIHFSPILRRTALPCCYRTVLRCPTHSFPRSNYYGCCRAPKLTPKSSFVLPADSQLHRRCRAQPTSTPPPPAHCGAVTHWHPITLQTPTSAVAASICQLQSTARDSLPSSPPCRAYASATLTSTTTVSRHL